MALSLSHRLLIAFRSEYSTSLESMLAGPSDGSDFVVNQTIRSVVFGDQGDSMN